MNARVSLCIAVGACLPAFGGCATVERNEAGFAVKRGDSAFAPKGSPWTIRCVEVRGPDRLNRINQVAGTLRRTPGIRPRDVIVTDDADGVARLYYGTYYRKTDPETGKRLVPKQLARDVELIKELGPPSGERYFIFARTVRVPTPDVGDPAWMLSSVDAAYSLQVGVFEPTDEFWDYKQAAADFCAALRDKGYEAYYHHGAGASMVTVGTFGEDAVVIPPRGLPYYRPEIIALQEDAALKYNLLNGRIYRAKADDGTKVPVKSRLVKVPARSDDTW